MARDLIDLFTQREQHEMREAASSGSTMLRDVHLRMAQRYRRLATETRTTRQGSNGGR